MSSNFERNREAETRAAQVAEKIEQLKHWLERNHPEISTGMATQKAFIDDMEDSFLVATDEDFQFSLDHMTTNISRQRVQTEEEAKQELIDKIMERLQSTNNQHWHVPHNVQTERTKMLFWDLEQLTARLNEVVRAQTIHAMSAVERRQIVESGRKYQGYPTLPKSIVRPGTVRAVPLDAAYLRGLDVFDLKRLTRLYSVEQVNNRLAGKD